jgi:GGDEF domain-containing protein
VLWAIVARLRTTLRADNLIARIGGDDFAIGFSVVEPVYTDSGVLLAARDRQLVLGPVSA